MNKTNEDMPHPLGGQRIWFLLVLAVSPVSQFEARL